MNKSDILLVGITVLLAFSFRCGYKEKGEISTLPIQPTADIVVAGNNQTIEILLDAIDRRAIARRTNH